jgi:chromosomal replication initiation ATPase DnaA
MECAVMEPLSKVRVIRKTDHNINVKRVLQIVDTVCQYYDLKKEKIFHRFKSREIAEKKHMIFWLIRKHTNLKLDCIGDMFGIDHSSISNGSKNFKRLLELDNSYETAVKDIEAQIL